MWRKVTAVIAVMIRSGNYDDLVTKHEEKRKRENNIEIKKQNGCPIVRE